MAIFHDSLNYLGYHAIDLFNWLFSDCRILFSDLGFRFNMELEDSAIVILRSKNLGTKGVINVGWFSGSNFPRYDFRTILHGTAGYISSDEFLPKNIYTYAAKVAMRNVMKKCMGKRIDRNIYTYYGISHIESLKNFINCITG